MQFLMIHVHYAAIERSGGLVTCRLGREPECTGLSHAFISGCLVTTMRILMSHLRTTVTKKAPHKSPPSLSLNHALKVVSLGWSRTWMVAAVSSGFTATPALLPPMF